ncbi:hypothetical protein ACHAWF_013106, partial [Thalassiosira exigua]
MPAPATPTTPSPTIDEAALLQSAAKPISTRQLAKLHADPQSLPDVRPCNTPAACESRTKFETLKLHRIFGCRKFKNYKHLTSASANGTLLHSGELPPSLGDFATIANPPRGKPIKKHRRYLDKVHMDIVYGDCLALGGFRYALLLVDVATRYCWIYGMTSLTSPQVVASLEAFKSDAEGVPRKFHCDFDRKLMGGAALRWINTEGSKVIAANASRQSSNGLVERTWRSIVQMARAYVTEKQVGREFWFFAIAHGASMINQVPGRLGRKLTTPFELVHGCKPDTKTWFELFSVGYFNHPQDGDQARSNVEDQSLDGIAVGRDEKSNTIVFYNPITKSYYRPQAFRLDESRLPATTFPTSIRYDGGLTCGLFRNRTDPVPEPFPPGTRVNVKRDEAVVRGTIQRVPIFASPLVQTAASQDDASPSSYAILLDDGTTVERSFEDLTSSSPADRPPSETAPNPFASLPHFLQLNAKLTMDHEGSFHKGYLGHTPEGGFRFEVRRNLRSTKIDRTVPLPDFHVQWPTLLGEDVLIPGHSTVSTFLKPSTSNNAPSANFVSAKNLFSPCPPSLLQALHPSNPDRHVWLDSYLEEKEGLESLDVFERISKKQYLALKRKGLVPKALPSMCVLVVKPDKDGKPHRAKSRIV